LDEAEAVARWLAAKAAEGAPALVVTYPSGAVSACAAALERGLDVTGSFFYVGGEPYTTDKARVVERAGARAVSWYGMTETGTIGLPCDQTIVSDEVHLLPYKIAVLQRPTHLGAVDLNTLLVTVLVPYAPKLMLNVDTGDYGVIEERDCDCALGRAGFRRHLHGIRSHEKLTAAGMTFLGDDLLILIEDVLPSRYGGSPEDYQLVEEEGSDGRARVTLVASPRLGDLDNEQMIETMLGHLSAAKGTRLMADVWRGASAVRVVRREPHLTSGGKIQPLHLLRGR
jgi:phenylacetate-coenzyme A ligase PaaK-like adenylate-forming protein